MRTVAEWLERHQVALYLAALAAGATLALLIPGSARPGEHAIAPLLGVLLYATFLGVPFSGIARGLRDWRFLGALLLLNFVVVPAVVWLVSRTVAHDRVLLIGVLFVLLTPCIDYVIVFTGLAGGAQDRLLAAAPILMVAQMLLLPVELWSFAGAEFAGSVDLAPFGEALLWLIAVPLGAAVLTQLAASRSSVARSVLGGMQTAMVPLMMATLAAVVASQFGGALRALPRIALVVPVFALFAAVMVVLGILAGRLAGLDVPGRRALVFSGVTRNSLVVLPLVLALPPAFALAPLVVVTQTLVELVAMVALVRLLPRLIRTSR